MSVTMVALATPRPGGEEDARRYTEGVLPLIQAAGGSPRGRLRIDETVVGAPRKGRLLLVDFPTAAAIQGLFESEEYASLIATRDRAFERFEVLLCSAA